MHTTARYFVKTAFLFFVLGLLSGLYMYAGKVFGWTVPANMGSAHAHVMLMGGMLMMILGVATWFFPRPTEGDTRYKPRLVKALYWVFTLATLGRYITEISFGLYEYRGLQVTGLVASALQIGATLGLISTLWSRIRPVGSHLREAKGEKF